MGVSFVGMGADSTRVRGAQRRRVLSFLATASVGTIAGFGMTAPAVTAAPGASGAGHHAVAARVLSITEKAQMHLASAPGVTIKEKGTEKGTFNEYVVATFTSYSVSRGYMTLTAYGSGGEVTIQGESTTRVSGATAYAEGTVRITRGTGKYAHASSNSLHFHAVINRRNFSILGELQGRMSI